MPVSVRRLFTMLALWQFTWDPAVRCVVVASKRVLDVLTGCGISAATCGAALSLTIKDVGSLNVVSSMHPRHAAHRGRALVEFDDEMTLRVFTLLVAVFMAHGVLCQDLVEKSDIERYGLERAACCDTDFVAALQERGITLTPRARRDFGRWFFIHLYKTNPELHRMYSVRGGVATVKLVRAALAQAAARGDAHLTQTLVAQRAAGIVHRDSAQLALLGRRILLRCY